MIRFISDPEHGVFTAEASGSLVEIISEIGLCVNTAYNLIRSRNPPRGKPLRTLCNFRTARTVLSGPRRTCRTHKRESKSCE